MIAQIVQKLFEPVAQGPGKGAAEQPQGEGESQFAGIMAEGDDIPSDGDTDMGSAVADTPVMGAEQVTAAAPEAALTAAAMPMAWAGAADNLDMAETLAQNLLLAQTNGANALQGQTILAQASNFGQEMPMSDAQADIGMGAFDLSGLAAGIDGEQTGPQGVAVDDVIARQAMALAAGQLTQGPSLPQSDSPNMLAQPVGGLTVQMPTAQPALAQVVKGSPPLGAAGLMADSLGDTGADGSTVSNTAALPQASNAGQTTLQQTQMPMAVMAGAAMPQMPGMPGQGAATQAGAAQRGAVGQGQGQGEITARITKMPSAEAAAQIGGLGPAQSQRQMAILQAFERYMFEQRSDLSGAVSGDLALESFHPAMTGADGRPQGTQAVTAGSFSLTAGMPNAPLSAQLLPFAQAAQSGPVQVLLSPVELGQLRFEIQHRGEGVQILLSAERPDTLDLLRRNSDQLLADFRNAGFSGASLAFGGWGGAGQGQSAPPSHEPDFQTDAPDTPQVLAQPAIAFGQTKPLLDPSRSLNLRL